MPDIQRTLAEALARLPDNTTAQISPQDLRDAIVTLSGSGWAQYSDTQYTEASPFSVVANTDTVLPNNGASVISTYLPRDVTSLYNGAQILGVQGDAYSITVDAVAVPTSQSTDFIEFWFDIGGAVGELYRRIITFPRGANQVRPINYTVGVYTLDTWQANGATVFVRANGPVNLYNIRYVITRTHRGGLNV